MSSGSLNYSICTLFKTCYKSISSYSITFKFGTDEQHNIKANFHTKLLMNLINVQDGINDYYLQKNLKLCHTYRVSHLQECLEIW